MHWERFMLERVSMVTLSKAVVQFPVPQNRSDNRCLFKPVLALELELENELRVSFSILLSIQVLEILSLFLGLDDQIQDSDVAALPL